MGLIAGGRGLALVLCGTVPFLGQKAGIIIRFRSAITTMTFEVPDEKAARDQAVE